MAAVDVRKQTNEGPVERRPLDALADPLSADPLMQPVQPAQPPPQQEADEGAQGTGPTGETKQPTEEAKPAEKQVLTAKPQPLATAKKLAEAWTWPVRKTVENTPMHDLTGALAVRYSTGGQEVRATPSADRTKFEVLYWNRNLADAGALDVGTTDASCIQPLPSEQPVKKVEPEAAPKKTDAGDRLWAFIEELWRSMLPRGGQEGNGQQKKEDTGPLDYLQIKKAREVIAKERDEKTREDLYRRLQERVIYRSQRDNEATLDGAKVETAGGNMCNLTSLAMCLNYLGLGVPEGGKQFEDFLEARGQALAKAKGYTWNREWDTGSKVIGWSDVAKDMGAVIVGAYWRDSIVDPAFWKNTVGKKHLGAGHAVLMGIYGHIIRVQGVTEAGVVVDDPYGKRKLGQRFEVANPRADQQKPEGKYAGEDVTHTWEELKTANSNAWVYTLKA